MKRLVIVIGEPYSGKDEWLSQQVLAGGGRAHAVDLQGGQRSIRWACKKVRELLEREGVETVYFADDCAVQRGTRQSLINACEGAAVELSAVVVNCLGGDLRVGWEREWTRSCLGHAKPSAARDGAARAAYSPPDVSEGYNVMYRTSQKLVPQSNLSTVGLVLDAAVLVHSGMLRNGITTLLHAWYRIPSSTKVVIVTVPSHAALQKGWCSDQTLGEMVNVLHAALASLRAPFPIYVYASLTAGHAADTPPSFIDAVGSGVWSTADASALDFAYLQHRHSLFLNYTFVVSSTSLLGSTAEKLRKVCKSVGMRYVDANALFSAVASGADASVVLKKVAERPPERQAVKAFVSEHAAVVALSNIYPLLERAGDRAKEIVSVRSERNVTVHRLVMDDTTASLFSASVASLQKPQETARQQEEAGGLGADGHADDGSTLLKLEEQDVAARFGSDQMARGSKFFRKNMVQLVGVEALPGAAAAWEVRMTCLSADGSKSYSVLVAVAAKPCSGGGGACCITSSLCECEKNIVDGSSVCRHAAACGIYLALNGAHAAPPPRAAQPPPVEPAPSAPPFEAPPVFADTPSEQPPPSADEGAAARARVPHPKLGIVDQLARVQVTEYPLPDLRPAAKSVASHLPAFMLGRQHGAAVAKRSQKTSARRAPEPRAAPNAPKRPMTSYFCFLRAVREEVLRDNPGTAAPALARLQGDMWRALSEADRQTYADQAAQDRVRYEKEMAAYRTTAEFKAAQEMRDEQRVERQAAKKSATVAAAAAPTAREEGNGLERQDSEAAFYARFQRNTSWRLVEGRGWVHEWDDDDGDAPVHATAAPAAHDVAQGAAAAAPHTRGARSTAAAQQRAPTSAGGLPDDDILSSVEPIAPLSSAEVIRAPTEVASTRLSSSAHGTGPPAPAASAPRGQRVVDAKPTMSGTGSMVVPIAPMRTIESNVWDETDGTEMSDDTVDRLATVEPLVSFRRSGAKRTFSVFSMAEAGSVGAAAVRESAAAGGPVPSLYASEPIEGVAERPSTFASSVGSLGESLGDEIDDLFFGAKKRKR